MRKSLGGECGWIRQQFVAAIAGQRNGDIAAGEAADDEGRDLRAVGERLVIHGGEQGDDVPRLCRRDDLLVVDGTEVSRDRAGVGGFVVSGFIEPDRVGAHRGRAAFW